MEEQNKTNNKSAQELIVDTIYNSVHRGYLKGVEGFRNALLEKLEETKLDSETLAFIQGQLSVCARLTRITKKCLTNSPTTLKSPLQDSKSWDATRRDDTSRGSEEHGDTHE